MRSLLLRDALRRLRRHGIRTGLAMVTIAAAIAALWLFAVPRGIDGAVALRDRQDRFHHLQLSPASLHWADDPDGPPGEEQSISAAELAAIGDLPNVEHVDSRPVVLTRVRAGGIEEEIHLVGVEDFDDQQVNLVHVASGAAPRFSRDDPQVMAETANARTGRLIVAVGDQVEIQAGDGVFYPFTVTGTGGTVRWSTTVADGTPVFYVPADMVRLLTGTVGFNTIEIRLADPAAARETLAAVREHLSAAAPEMGYARIAEIREPGTFPHHDQVERLMPLLWVIALLGLASAAVLVATTVGTIVRDQTTQIGVMRALGATRRDVRRGFLQLVLILGASGTLIGVAAGVVLSRALGGFVHRELLGFDAGGGVDLAVAVGSVAAGLGGSVLAGIPALRRALRIPVREALTAHGLGDADRSSRVIRALPLRRMTRLGVRNATRHRARSTAIAVQVALGVGVAIAFGAFAVTGLSLSRETLEQEASDITVWADRGVLDSDAAAAVHGLPGVAAVQPTVQTQVEFAGGRRTAWGLPADPIYGPDMAAGRWFTADEIEGRARVAVIGAPLAEMTGTEVGDHVEIAGRNTVEVVEVIGLDAGLVANGTFLWLPLDTMLEIEQLPSAPMLWVETTSPAPETVDAVASQVRDLFGSKVNVVPRYPGLQAAVAEDRVVVMVIQVLGLPIAAIGMIGLAGAMTTSVLDRTREIGVLRAIGARSRHLRRMLRGEGTAIAVFGWLIGVPIGYALARVIVGMFAGALHTSIPTLFPLWLPLAVLAGVVVMARLTLRPPLRRAVRMQPGAALRYE
jgi:putative ABC transport system permease protein